MGGAPPEGLANCASRDEYASLPLPPPLLVEPGERKSAPVNCGAIEYGSAVSNGEGSDYFGAHTGLRVGCNECRSEKKA